MQSQLMTSSPCAKGMVNIKNNIFSSLSIIFLLLLAVLSNIFLGNEKYMLVATVGALISIIPFFTAFENKRHTTREAVVIAVMIALCVSGRFIFTPIPHFKPVTALVIITGMYFGSDAGFITGSLTALVSNMQHGQGPWTVFQMAVWGLIGFFAGFLNKKGLLKNKVILLIFSGLCGVLYSLIMDVYTTISIDKVFSLERYLFYIATAVPIMLEYMISNTVFILVLEKPIGKKLSRIKTKYGLFM